jgi:hypothetical protein
MRIGGEEVLFLLNQISQLENVINCLKETGNLLDDKVEVERL